MGLFDFGSSNSRLSDFLRNENFESRGYEDEISVGAAIRLLGHLPEIRDQITNFVRIFSQGDTILNQEQKDKRYTYTQNSLNLIGQVNINGDKNPLGGTSGNKTLMDFMSHYNISEGNEDRMPFGAIIALIVHIQDIREPINEFINHMNKGKDYIFGEGEDKNRYDNTMVALNDIGSTTIDNIINKNMT